MAGRFLFLQTKIFRLLKLFIEFARMEMFYFSPQIILQSFKTTIASHPIPSKAFINDHGLTFLVSL